MLSSIRRFHRVLVRWVADTFDLPARGAAWRARTHHVAAHRWHHRALQHHRRRPPRVLEAWQVTIERILTVRRVPRRSPDRDRS